MSDERGSASNIYVNARQAWCMISKLPSTWSSVVSAGTACFTGKPTNVSSLPITNICSTVTQWISFATTATPMFPHCPSLTSAVWWHNVLLSPQIQHHVGSSATNWNFLWLVLLWPLIQCLWSCIYAPIICDSNSQVMQTKLCAQYRKQLMTLTLGLQCLCVTNNWKNEKVRCFG